MKKLVRVNREEWWPVLVLTPIVSSDMTSKNDLNLDQGVVNDYLKAFIEFKLKENLLVREIEETTNYLV